RDRGQHENHRRPGGRLGQYSGRASRPEGGLAAHAAERSRNICALAALQQHNQDQEQANNDVNRRNQVNHVESVRARDATSFQTSALRRLKMVRKGGFEPPRLSAPPPQDGVSASSTTSAHAGKNRGTNSEAL